jgi:nucleoside-diphosphate kinase|uniref:Nucleoside diphosphate kinase n=1 Tax=Leptospirillum ferriphilum TaxID=178606 RepID=A0A7C3QVT9_9BACT
MIERTLAIVKPDAYRKNFLGAILARYEKEGFRVCAAKLRWLSQREVEGFYHVHRERPFFSSLTRFMASGPVMILVLEKENAISDHRALMGATDPQKSESGTLRKLYGGSIEENAIHGSDSPETARFEIAYFFPSVEIF